jgi:signal transduction histidine kinase
LWFYFYLWNNDKNLQKNYKLWFIKNNNTLIFRWDYFWYNIILWKKLNEIINFEQKFYEILLFLNIFLIFLSFLISYFIARFSLLPLYKLSEFLNNYNFSNKNDLIKNNYKNTEIWFLTESINKFIKQNNNILEIQKNFIQDVSHELKTPLMQIESNIELIEWKIQEEKIKNKIEQIKNSTKDINQIISNLGFILRWEEILKNKEKINIYKYFKKFVKNYEVLANKKNIKIGIVKKFDLVLENNSYYLDRLFWNLISNAIHYNDWNNTIKIIINKNEIIIKDEWIWIEKEELNKIFSRFYRNKNSTLYYNSGNWLWLVIVKKIINMFGWKIEIKSEKWAGSEIKIVI